jgi:hypothetical protein
MTAQPGFFIDPDTAEGGSPLIAHGGAHGRVALRAAADRLVVVVTGEATGESLLECFHAAMKQNVILSDMRTLVDLTRFVGAVDWKAVFSLRHMAPWGEGGRSRVAYLFADMAFAAPIKILSATFVHTRHRGFTDRDAAIKWLDMIEP